MNQEPKSLRILLVENHAETVKWLRLFLEDLGHNVSTAKNIAEARDEIAQKDWEVLITDIGLPDGVGWELLEGKMDRTPAFSVAMSGFGMNADGARSRAAGFRDHLLKPFKLRKLEELLEQAATELRQRHP